MNDYVTDEEQVERIKNWWKENGSSVVVGLVLGIGGLSGWRFWVDYQTSEAGEASARYSQVLNALEAQRNDQAIEQASNILDNYSSTPYAELSRLALARAFVESGDFAQAASQLESLIDQTADQGMEMIARKRLAAVQLQLGQYDTAMNTLDVDYPAPFSAAFEELRGDILRAKGNPNEAREAYQKARLANPANPRFLQRKIDDLGLIGASS